MATATTEGALREEVSRDLLTGHNAEIAKGVRLSGSADEAEAFAYIAAQCRSYGTTVHEHTTDAYVSLPGAASLAVVAPEQRELTCITHSASAATPAEGLNGRLVYAVFDAYGWPHDLIDDQTLERLLRLPNARGQTTCSRRFAIPIAVAAVMASRRRRRWGRYPCPPLRQRA